MKVKIAEKISKLLCMPGMAVIVFVAVFLFVVLLLERIMLWLLLVAVSPLIWPLYLLARHDIEPRTPITFARDIFQSIPYLWDEIKELSLPH
jgi:hypothetical protein